MKLRPYVPLDAPRLAVLFYDTVHTVNAADYTPEQLDAWAPADRDLEAWARSFEGHFALTALEGEEIVGFGDVAPSGYLDRLYVHKDFQRRGIASVLCEALEGAYPVEEIVTHASLTARPFFLSRGYREVRRQEVVRKNVRLVNFVMTKRLGLAGGPW